MESEHIFDNYNTPKAIDGESKIGFQRPFIDDQRFFPQKIDYFICFVYQLVEEKIL